MNSCDGMQESTKLRTRILVLISSQRLLVELSKNIDENEKFAITFRIFFDEKPSWRKLKRRTYCCFVLIIKDTHREKPSRHLLAQS